MSVFRQRVLTKLFPSEEESDSDDDDEEEEEDVKKTSQASVRTENTASHETLTEGEKRKLSEAEGSFSLNIYLPGFLKTGLVKISCFLRQKA